MVPSKSETKAESFMPLLTVCIVIVWHYYAPSVFSLCGSGTLGPAKVRKGPFLAGADIRGCRRRIPRSPRAIRAGSRSCIAWIGFLNDLFYAELYRRIGRVVNFR